MDVKFHELNFFFSISDLEWLQTPHRIIVPKKIFTQEKKDFKTWNIHLGRLETKVYHLVVSILEAQKNKNKKYCGIENKSKNLKSNQLCSKEITVRWNEKCSWIWKYKNWIKHKDTSRATEGKPLSTDALSVTDDLIGWWPILFMIRRERRMEKNEAWHVCFN